ncbi:uncharacterized protein SCHCODRAFT_02623571 [Schizophyllum commune H4-8]|nr:uncharacterized protein SCHCODRAFT_02623571 [Schizophyllum commune H4-8]KAI5894049.1 hypothetical protein SCHCODRAFT_02623571 [Schizophyllum commune H4-8]
MATSTERRRDEVEEAYEVQARAGIRGGIQAFAMGVGATLIAHYQWPWFKRQTLQFKAMIICATTVSGLTIAAEHALLEHENMRRREEAAMRRQARLELAKRGQVGTESEIASWRREMANQEKE